MEFENKTRRTAPPGAAENIISITFNQNGTLHHGEVGIDKSRPHYSFENDQIGLGTPFSVSGATTFALQLLERDFADGVKWKSPFIDQCVSALKASQAAGREGDVSREAGLLQIAANHLEFHRRAAGESVEQSTRLIQLGLDELVRACRSDDTRPELWALAYLSEAAVRTPHKTHA